MDPLLALDHAAFRWVYELALPLALVVGVTYLGTHGGVWVAAMVGLAAFGRGANRRTGIAMLLGGALHLLVIELVLKYGIGRARPIAALGLATRGGVGNPDSPSFPSGHAGISFMAAWVLSARFPRWRAPLLGLAGAIALSRIHLGAHYPSDVAAGAAIGIGIGVLATRIVPIDGSARPPVVAPF